MKGFRLWLGMLLALVLSACNNDGGVKSPDFTPVLQSILITPPSTITRGTGQTVQMQAIGTYSAPPGQSATTRDITTSVRWSSSDNDVVTVNDAGLAAFGAQEGPATITASLDGVDASVQVSNQGIILLSVVVTPSTAVVAPAGTQSYTAQGLYSDSDVPRDMPVTETISWTWVGSSGGSIGNGAAGKTVTVTAGTTEGVYTLRATNTSANVSGDAKLIIGQVTGLTVTLDKNSAPVGRAVQATATATFATTTGGGTIPPQEVAAIWTAAANPAAPAPSIDSSCDTAAEKTTSCNITGRASGQTVTVTAAYGLDPSITGSASFTVTDAVLDKVVIESLDPNVVIDPTTRSVEVGLGAAPSFNVRYFYSDGLDDLAPRSAGDKVSWSNSTPAVATLAVDAGSNNATVTTVAKGATNLTANTPAADALDDTITVNVGDATLQELLGVRPAKAYVIEGRTQEFVAFGRFSDNSVADLPDSSVTWASASATVATQVGSNTGVFQAGNGQAGNATTVTATSSNPAGSASADFIVTTNRCAIPIRAADSAVAAQGPSAGIGVFIVSDVNNVIDVDDTFLTFGNISSVLGLLNAYGGIDVFANANPFYTVPFPAGYTPGFIISLPAGPLLLADVLQQIEVSTLDAGGNALQTSGSLIPLRVDLLGLQLIGGTPQQQILVAIDTSEPFSGVRLRVKSGTAVALTDVNVFAACADSEPVTPVLDGIDSIYVESPAGGLPNQTVSVGQTVNFGALNLGGAPIPDADIDWTSSEAGNDPDANGVFTPSAAGVVTITAALKDQSLCTPGTCSATYQLTVIESFCETKLTGDVSFVRGGLCLLCSVANEDNIADGSDTTFGTLQLVLDVLGSLTVNVDVAQQAPSADRVGFLVSTTANNLLEAGLLNQIVVRTYLGATLQEESDGVLNPLNLDLLGADLDGFNYGTVSVVTSKPYDRVQLQFSSLLTALSLNSLQVNSTCANIVSP